MRLYGSGLPCLLSVENLLSEVKVPIAGRRGGFVFVYRDTGKRVSLVRLRPHRVADYADSIVAPPEGEPTDFFDTNGGGTTAHSDRVTYKSPSLDKNFDESHNSFKNDIAGGVVSEAKWMGGGAVGIFDAKIGDTRVAMKPLVPAVREELGFHHAAHRFASEAGFGGLMPDAAIASIVKSTAELESKGVKAGGSALAARFLTGFRVLKKISKDDLNKVDLDTRIVGAVQDLVFDNSDRHARNVMMNDSGEVRLIDQGRSFAKLSGNAKEIYRVPRSVFFGDGLLSYKHKVAGGTEPKLPSKMDKALKKLAAKSPEQVAEEYGVSVAQAEIMIERAGMILADGLDRAIELTGGRVPTADRLKRGSK